MMPISLRRAKAASRIVLATSSSAAKTSTAAVTSATHCSMLSAPRIGAMTLRMSCTRETPSSPCTALVMPSNCSGSSSVIQIVCGMSSAVMAGLSPENSSSP